jgi:cysteinyl-tRNA synthetase
MLRIYNTLSRSVEEFEPMDKIGLKVGMYSCGPTVYDYQHIGHMRRYVGDDILVRVLKSNGYEVKHVMNITDVGHLVSDEDTGEDKMEKGARKYGLSVWDIAKKFEQQFFDSLDSLGIKHADPIMHATDYIPEQIALIKTLEEKGYTYKIDDGIYFDTSKFPDYFALSRQNPEELKKGARVEFVEGKKNPADFALWKFSPEEDGLKRQMEWDSPWGIGFPGWHIECSAMSMKALGPHFDIHTGGIDHINIHHSNEIAQSECATGEKFVNYWVHHNFLIVNGEKMSKSLGNFYTVQDVMDKGFDPLSLRYLYLQTHYRQEMNFTWESLEAAQTAYNKLIREVELNSEAYSSSEAEPNREFSSRLRSNNSQFETRFFEALNDDLNTAKALSIVWELVKSDLDPKEKLQSLKKFDEVLGLQLFTNVKREVLSVNIPEEVMDFVKEREGFRKAGDWEASDELRKKIYDLGFTIEDSKDGPRVKKLSS